MPKLIPLKCRGDEDQREEEYVDLEEEDVDRWSESLEQELDRVKGF